jgi:hypothetical protein
MNNQCIVWIRVFWSMTQFRLVDKRQPSNFLAEMPLVCNNRFLWTVDLHIHLRENLRYYTVQYKALSTYPNQLSPKASVSYIYTLNLNITQYSSIR